MTKKYSPDDLKSLANTPGWRLDANGKAEREGTLEEVAKAAHARRTRGEQPGIIRRIENAVELEMLQLEQLWRDLGLPV